MMIRTLIWVLLMAFAVVENPVDGSGIQLRGAARELWNYRGRECLIDGPAETGKTFAGCLKLFMLNCKYPGSQSAIIRQVRADMPGTVLQTFERVASNAIKNGAVKKFGGERVDFYQFWNGSRIWIGGLDRPGSVLSSERDFVYICQMEQISLNAYEYITTRCSGRAGNAPYPQIMGDSNPDDPKHWIMERVKAGKLRMFKSTHKDNPRLWDGINWTPEGVRSMEVLDGLTGVRRKRLRDGLWCGVEGLVYENFDATIHVIDPFEIPKDWQRYIAIDWGHRDPMVVQWWANKGAYNVMYREIYQTGKAVEDVAQDAGRLSKGEKIELGITDHDPQKKMTFVRNFMKTYDGPRIMLKNADKDIALGIQDVEQGLKTDPEGVPYIRLFRNARAHRPDPEMMELHKPVSTEDEYACYAWPEDVDGKPRKEEPVDKDNHGMDCTRYYCRYLAKLKGRESRPKARVA